MPQSELAKRSLTDADLAIHNAENLNNWDVAHACIAVEQVRASWAIADSLSELFSLIKDEIKRGL